ncbi:flippase-like domain-containing protein [Tardiphaga sp. vice154]|uniref:lysylphosphatidylglycerol synthase transmembrane domain-containing protein n=1 Tax=Tardiphaga sp. vice154 TaxID=2592814 RepID=UPI001162B72E|nr:lysylphosphatidylglycerol synthase transmembrane domain-containing protein [Tardiphaga sp. vice154]QDM23004.1 flippase-like domain-containing protein [Tardiphaga sp. vice154]
MRLIGHPLFKLLTTILLFVLISLKVDVAEAGKRLLTLPPLFAAAVTATAFFALLVQAYKTKILLPERSVGAILRVSIVSQIYSIVFLGQVGGDIAKAGYLVRTPAELHRIVAAVVFDRITGLIGLLVLGLAGLLFNTQHFDPVIAPTLAFTMVLLLTAMLAMFFLNDASVAKLFGWLPDLISRQLRDTVVATHVFSSSVRTLVASIAMGIAFQAVVVANCAWLGAGLGIDLSLASWAVVICVMSLVLLLPISFGGIGLRDVTLVGLLGGSGVATERALALSLALLGLQLAMAAVGGILTLLPYDKPAAED